jgi:hypothetical protein
MLSLTNYQVTIPGSAPGQSVSSELESLTCNIDSEKRKYTKGKVVPSVFDRLEKPNNSLPFRKKKKRPAIPERSETNLPEDYRLIPSYDNPDFYIGNFGVLNTTRANIREDFFWNCPEKRSLFASFSERVHQRC